MRKNVMTGIHDLTENLTQRLKCHLLMVFKNQNLT